MNVLQKLLLPTIQLQTIIDYLLPEHKELLLQSLAGYDIEKIESIINHILDNTTDIQLKLKLRAFNIGLDNSYWHLRELQQYSSHNVIELMLDTESNVIDVVNGILNRYSINNAQIAKEVYNELFIHNSQRKKQNKAVDLDDIKRDLDLLKKAKK